MADYELVRGRVDSMVEIYCEDCKSPILKIPRNCTIILDMSALTSRMGCIVGRHKVVPRLVAP